MCWKMPRKYTLLLNDELYDGSLLLKVFLTAEWAHCGACTAGIDIV
jgi:hypothetical protein